LGRGFGASEYLEGRVQVPALHGTRPQAQHRGFARVRLEVGALVLQARQHAPFARRDVAAQLLDVVRTPAVRPCKSGES
jgi:hypothetical protein